MIHRVASALRVPASKAVGAMRCLNLHEYQSKDVMEKYGVRMQKGACGVVWCVQCVDVGLAVVQHTPAVGFNSAVPHDAANRWIDVRLLTPQRARALTLALSHTHTPPLHPPYRQDGR